MSPDYFLGPLKTIPSTEVTFHSPVLAPSCHKAVMESLWSYLAPPFCWYLSFSLSLPFFKIRQTCFSQVRLASLCLSHVIPKEKWDLSAFICFHTTILFHKAAVHTHKSSLRIVSTEEISFLMACTGFVISSLQTGLKSSGSTSALVMVTAEQRLPHYDRGLSLVAAVPATGKSCQRDPVGTCNASDFTGKYSSKWGEFHLHQWTA